jgi:hypothetical protein
MEHRRSKLALFFAAQALAVGMMILALPLGRMAAGRGAGGDALAGPSMIGAVLVILGELWILARTLREEGPVWRSILALGILALVAAPFAFVLALHVPWSAAKAVVIWHVAGGLLLLVTGTAGGVWQLLARLRRSDERAAEEGGSSAMWPLD